MTVEVDLVEADLEGLSVAVTRLALARLIAVNTFGGICSMDDSFAGIRRHILFSIRCAGDTVLSAESAARVQHWRAESALGNCAGRLGWPSICRRWLRW
jgi:hypothetical protein